MIITLTNSDPRPIYRQIFDEVVRGGALGTIQPDECLPSIRQLALELRVNPNTVKQAYQELERNGVVYVRRGQGTYLAPAEGARNDRSEVARAIARHAVEEAARSGLSPEELIQAVRDLREPEEPQKPAEVEGGGDDADKTE